MKKRAAALCFLLLLCAASGMAQISLRPMGQLKLPCPIQPRTVDVQRTASGFQVNLDGAQALRFDSTGRSLGAVNWMGLNPAKGNRMEPLRISGPHLVFGNYTLRVAGNQLTLLNAAGRPVYGAIFGESHRLPYAFRSHPQDSIWYMADIHNAWQTAAVDPYVVLPLTCTLDEAYENRRPAPYPNALLPYLVAENWLPSRPSFALYRLDTSQLKRIPVAESKQLKSWQPDLLVPLALIGPQADQLYRWQQTGRLSPWLNQPLAAWSASGDWLCFTSITQSSIELYSPTGEKRLSIPKQGFQAESLFTFPASLLDEKILQVGGTPASTIQSAKGCLLPAKHEQEVIDYLLALSAAAYGRSTSDEQLAASSNGKLLLRILSKPKPDQDSIWWAEKLRSNYLPQEQVNALRARTLQIYDLAAGGRFDGEIEVPPLFRILGIDPQGNLWAVTAVDETSVTVGRFRLLREGQ